MKQVIGTIFGVAFRVVMLLAGLVFFASLLVAVLLLLALWLVRSLGARLTGQAVVPWTFQVDRQAMWKRFYGTPERSRASQRDDANVVDVQPKEIKFPER